MLDKNKKILTQNVDILIKYGYNTNCIVSSDDGVEETLLSIPNRKVKLYSANGTARETVWESRTLLGNMAR